jgi:glycosyltransferase involved in cell wall biosynthesis
MTLVTFVTPTKGRPSIRRMVTSLLQQNDPDWRLIIIGDNCVPQDFLMDDRIYIITSTPKIGNAGEVRNIGLDNMPIYPNEWIAFVDDDDWLDTDYVSHLRMYANNNPNVDIFQFTYVDIENGNMQPAPGIGHKPLLGHMGISFAVKDKFIQNHNIRFRNCVCEDYYFLKDCIDAGAIYFNTNRILYFVGHRSAWS